MIFYCPGMLIIPFLFMNSNMFQSANEHKGIECRPATGDVIAKQGICVKPYPGNSNQSNMEKKQVKHENYK